MYFQRWQGDCNVYLTIMYHMIKRIVESRDPSATRPRFLYIQADNCCGENRSRWHFAFYGYLVHLGWYDEIHFYSMVVGVSRRTARI